MYMTTRGQVFAAPFSVAVYHTYPPISDWTLPKRAGGAEGKEQEVRLPLGEVAELRH
jgi:hypothetical protein